MAFRLSRFLVISFVVLIYLVEIRMNSSTITECSEELLTEMFKKEMKCQDDCSEG
jgi:hypothetical protein